MRINLNEPADSSPHLYSVRPVLPHRLNFFRHKFCTPFVTRTERAALAWPITAVQQTAGEQQ